MQRLSLPWKNWVILYQFRFLHMSFFFLVLPQFVSRSPSLFYLFLLSLFFGLFLSVPLFLFLPPLSNTDVALYTDIYSCPLLAKAIWFYRLFEEKYGISFVRRSTVGLGGQFCGRFRLLGIQKY